MKQRRIHCKHFNGIIHDRCKAGIKYVPGHIDQCIGRGVDETAPCAKLEYLTPDEVAQKEAESTAMMEKFYTAREAIVKVTRGKACSGIIKCPNCGGELSFSVARNGHIHAQCHGSCGVAWME